MNNESVLYLTAIVKVVLDIIKSMTQSQTLLALLAAVVLISITHRCDGSTTYDKLCPPCNTTGCNDPPTGCEFGVVQNLCGKSVCAQGPGDRCGGPSDIMGKCTGGTTCNCEHCTGCAMGVSDTEFKCYSNDFLCRN